MKKKAPKITLRQKKLVKEIIKGKSQREAAKIAGYDKKSADVQVSQDLKKLKNDGTFAKILDKCGLSDESLGEDIDRLRKFSRKQVIKKGKDEYEVVEIADGNVQLGAVKLAVQLKGHLVEKKEHSYSESMLDLVKRHFEDKKDGNS